MMLDHLTEVHAAYVAALIEGEGCISVGVRGLDTFAVLSLVMTDEDVVNRLYSITRLGTFGRDSRNTVKDKAVWFWRVSKQEQVLALLERLLTLLLFSTVCSS